MGKINWGRVISGGLLAGVVANILGFGSWYLFLKAAWDPALEALGRPMQESMAQNIFWVVFTFVAGVIAVWLYAAVRPRYGPGPKTAACAGFSFWLMVSLLPTVAWGSLLQLPQGVLVTDAATGLVIWVVATVVGAWPYTE